MSAAPLALRKMHSPGVKATVAHAVHEHGREGRRAELGSHLGDHGRLVRRHRHHGGHREEEFGGHIVYERDVRLQTAMRSKDRSLIRGDIDATSAQ